MAKVTHVHFILDDSASMSVVREATISGFNEYIKTLKNDGNKYRFTLTKFHHQPTTGVTQDIQKVPELTPDNYQANGDSTALYDAVCYTLNAAKDQNKRSKHLVIVMTDGEENSSREHNEQHMKQLKEELEKRGNWTFVFLGANQDSYAKAQRYGYSGQNVSNFNQTFAGTYSVFSNLARSTGTFAAQSATLSTKAYFTAQQQKEMGDTK